MTLLRPFAALAIASTLSACTPTPLMRSSLDTLEAAFTGPPTLEQSRADVEANPNYQLKIGTPYGEASMVLGRLSDGQEYWATSTRQVLVIQHGLVRRSVGFPEDLEGSRFIGPDPFAEGLHHLADGAESVRELDWKKDYRFGVRVHSRFTRHGLERVEILGDTHELLRIDETLRTEDATFKATNHYWVDPEDGFIFVSQQNLSPELPVTLTQLRPYREAAR